VKKSPKPADIAQAMRALQQIPSENVMHGWRRSLNNVPNYRVAGMTNDLDWTVDIYANGFFVTTVGNRPSEQTKSLRSMIAYLCAMLGVKLP
jgi:hypothetical protein